MIGNEKERHPIMRSTGRHSNSHPQTGPEGVYDGPRPMQYDAIQVNPVPLSHLRNEGGGYLGPAALENVNLDMPTPASPQYPNARPSNLNLGNNAAASNNNRPYNAAGKMNAQSVAGSLDMDTSSSYQSERNRDGIKACLTCTDRTGCEQALLMSGAILLIIIITLAIGIGFMNSQGLFTGNPPCQSRECIKAAGAILESLDENVAPCDNFVEFACGGWYGKNPVPESAFRWSMLDILDETTLYELKHLLEEKPDGDESLQVQAARKVYQACVNNTAWTKVGITPLMKVLEEAGGLPLINPNWSSAGFQLETLLSWSRRAGWMPIVSLGVLPDLVNNSHYAVYFSQGQLQLPLGQNASNTTQSQKASRVTYMTKIGLELLKASGLGKDEAAVEALEKDIIALWNFSVELAEISVSDNDMTDPWQSYNRMSIDEFTNSTNNNNNITLKINWLEYIQKVYEGTNITFNGNDTIIVETPTYFRKLMTVLNRTNPRTIVNFVLFEIIYSMAEDTSTSLLRVVHEAFEEKLWTFGRTDLRPWHDCAGKTRILLRMAVGQLYFKKHSLENAKELAEKMVSDIALAFKEMLSSADWMSASAREEAQRKLDSMIMLVGYPAFLLNDTLMDEQFGQIPEVSTSDHFGNVMSLTKWISMRSLVRISRSPVRKTWVSGPLEINAFYTSIQNALMLPGGVLTPPLFYHDDLPALNYGGIGAIIGHEITHGFDTNGRYFDWHGELSKGWDKETIKMYLNKSKCFEKQYSSYNVTDLLAPFDTASGEMKIDPISSSGENIADNGGLRAAWKAYQKHVDETGNANFKLPGLENYTQDQLFFISFSKLWCMQFTPFALQYTVSNDRHPPGHYRILGTLQNNQDFSTAFRCPLGSPMNPHKKCLLW